MRKGRILKIIAIITYLLLIPISLYFKMFPTIISLKITSYIIISLVSFLIIFLTCGSFLCKTNIDLLYLLPQSLMITFIATAIPNLRLEYPPLHDPYYYFVSAQNIIQYGTLEPLLHSWFSGINILLHWPIMQLLTASLTLISNINPILLFRYQGPSFSILFFLLVFLLSKEITKHNGVALLSGLFASLNEIILFYQSEYHAQGFAILITVFVLYLFIKSRNNSNIIYRGILIYVCIIYTLSHYFMAIFLSSVFFIYLVSNFVLTLFLKHNLLKEDYSKIINGSNNDSTFLLIMIIVPLAHHFIGYNKFITALIVQSGMGTVLNANLATIGITNVPLLTSALSFSKWLLFAFAIASVIQIYKTNDVNEYRLATLLIGLIFLGIIGNYVVPAPLDRIIGYYVPIAAIFASLSFFRIKGSNRIRNHANKVLFILILFASFIIISGIFNSQVPAYYFKDSKPNTYYWYSNTLPKMNEYKVAGEWIGLSAKNNFNVGVEFDTRTIPFYFGKCSDSSVKKLYGQHTFDINSYEYIMVNPSITYNYDNNQKYNFGNLLNIIYDNNEIKIYSH